MRSWTEFFNINLLSHFEPDFIGEKSILYILQ